jgi:hypothetical protein
VYTATNGTGKPQKLEVLLGNGTQPCVLFNIDTPCKPLRHPVEVHAEAARQVDERSTKTFLPISWSMMGGRNRRQS